MRKKTQTPRINAANVSQRVKKCEHPLCGVKFYAFDSEFNTYGCCSKKCRTEFPYAFRYVAENFKVEATLENLSEIFEKAEMKFKTLAGRSTYVGVDYRTYQKLVTLWKKLKIKADLEENF